MSDITIDDLNLPTPGDPATADTWGTSVNGAFGVLVTAVNDRVDEDELAAALEVQLATIRQLPAVGADGQVLAVLDGAPGYVELTPADIGAQPAGSYATTDALAAVEETASAAAPLASPAFTGTPTAPTPSAPSNGPQIATTEFVHDALDAFGRVIVWPWQFVVEDTADDAAAIRAAVNAAVAYAVAHTFYAEVLFKGRKYLVNGALQQGGATKGNALIPLPVIAPTAHKVTLKFKGVGTAAALPHWLQTVPQAAGTVIQTTLTGLAYSEAYGNPSIIGGPTAEQIGYGVGNPAFNNMCVVIDGIQLQAPADPTMHGIDLGCTAEAIIMDLGCQASQVPSGAAAPTTYKSGLVMPYVGNNAISDIISYSVEGWYRGALIGEHTNIYSYRAIYCYSGVGLMYPMPHSGIAQYMCIEASFGFAVELVGVTAAYGDSGVFFDVQCLDIEHGGTIQDPANHWYGEVAYNNNGAGTLDLQGGAANVRFINRTATVGLQTAPSIPATTVALRNPFNRDATVIVTGGTVSAIAIDGQTTGRTVGDFRIDSGHSITLTYTGAPTWKWILT